MIITYSFGIATFQKLYHTRMATSRRIVFLSASSSVSVRGQKYAAISVPPTTGTRVDSRHAKGAPDAPLSYCCPNHDRQTQYAGISSTSNATLGLRCGPKSLRRLSVADGTRRREDQVAQRASEARDRLFRESRKSEGGATRIAQPNRSSSAPPPRQSGKKKHARQAFKFAAPTFALHAANTTASSSATLWSGAGQWTRRGPTHGSRKPNFRGGAGGRAAKPSGRASRTEDSLAYATSRTVVAAVLPVAPPRIQPASGGRSLDVGLGGAADLAMLMAGLGLGAGPGGD